MSQPVPVRPGSPAALIDRELSWLGFARRVLALAEDPEQPLTKKIPPSRSAAADLCGDVLDWTRDGVMVPGLVRAVLAGWRVSRRPARLR